MTIPQSPLRDDSCGALKSWPGGAVMLPGSPPVDIFRRCEPDEVPAARVVASPEESVWCKYCAADTLPLLLLEEVVPGRRTAMTICAECAYGLTPPEEVTQ